MLRSELAREFEIDPSVVTKRLKLYASLAGIEEPRRYLNDQIQDHMRKVNELLKNQTGMSTREAIQRVLGQFTEALPPAIALSIDQRLTSLEEGQGRLEDMVTELVWHIREAQERRAAQAQQTQEDALSLTEERALEHQDG